MPKNPFPLPPDLTGPEKDLIAKAKAGEWCWLGTTRPGKDDRDNAQNTIRAEVIRHMALGGDPNNPIHPKGVQLRGAWIAGKLDFDSRTLTRPLWLHDCHVDEAPDFLGATARTIGLSGSWVPSLQMDSLTTEGPVFLSNGFEVAGTVVLRDARIGGPLSCTGGKFLGAETALDADGLTTVGPVFLRDGFEAAGTVVLRSARIGDQLDCSGGKLWGAETALDADGLTTVGPVFLRDGFEAAGSIRLADARIGDRVELRGSRLFGVPDALFAPRMSLAGSLAFYGGCRASGCIQISGARISGDIRFMEFTTTVHGESISATSLKLSGSIYIGSGFSSSGEVDFGYSIVQGDAVITNSEFLAENRTLNLAGIHIGGDLIINSLNSKRGFMNLIGAKVRQFIDFNRGWPAPGKIALDGFRYKGFGFTEGAMADRAAWLLRQPDEHLGIDFRPQPFEQLAKVLRKTGHTEDAKRVAMLKQHYERGAARLQALARIAETKVRLAEAVEARRTCVDAVEIARLNREIWSARGVLVREPLGWRLRWVVSRLFGLIAGYGYRPIYSFGWAVVFVAVGTLIFGEARDAGSMVPNSPVLLKQEWKEAVTDDPVNSYTEFAAKVPDFQPFNSLVYSIDTFVPIINLHQETNWIPHPKNGGLATVARVYLWIHIIAGWVITALLAASVTGMVKKDV